MTPLKAPRNASAVQALVTALALAATGPAAALSLGVTDAASSSLPNSIAALGDSITRAFNADSWFDNPQHSWSTGYESGDGVNSHYERILDQNRQIRGDNYNYAVSGAEMIDLNGQAQNAVAANAEYVTVLMGANDVCAGSLAGVTDPADFDSQLRAAAATLKNGLPGSTVYFVSIPDVYHLWYILHDDWRARWAWDAYDVCQSMLSESRTEEERQWVRSQNVHFNELIEQVVLEAQSEGYDWHWDGWAVFNYDFVRGHVSTKDYFHPDLDGEAVLADETWRVGPLGP